MSRRCLPLLLALSLLLFDTAVSASETAEGNAHFAPLDFLVGHCWRGTFDDGSSDVQCYERLYDGQFIRNTHHLSGKDGQTYGGMTLFSWDGEQKRIRFHYFTSSGAVSEGHFESAEGGIRIPERHAGDDGSVTELLTHYTPVDDYSYRVSTRSRKADHEDWSTMLDVVYRRTDAPDADAIDTLVSTEAGDWQLVWSRSMDDGWAVVTRQADGQTIPLLGPKSEGAAAGDAWVWSVHGSELILLGKWGDDEDTKGWQPARWSPGMAAPALITADRVGDSSFDCHPAGWPCALSLRLDGKRRIALVDADGKRRMLGNGSAEDSDALWSPDGKQLLWRSNRGGSWELWLGDTSGDNGRALTRDDANNDVALHAYGGEGPAQFSPDGKRIVWTRRFPDIGFDVWIMDVDGNDPRNLSADHKGSDAYPSVSPDGQWIAFGSDRSGDSEIYRMRLDGSGVQRISFHPSYEGAPMWWLAKPARND